MSKWQPIETAPKDSNDHVILTDGDLVTIGWSDNGVWHNAADHDPFGSEMDPQPTHWMPLPEPPK